jgi:putative Holliday junction resolvase
MLSQNCTDTYVVKPQELTNFAAMARVMAIDYGSKRCGIAVTDPLRIIATALKTVPTSELDSFLKEYFSKESVNCLVIGEPFRYDGSASSIEVEIQPFIARFQENFPDIEVQRINEMFTSKQAMKTLIASGLSKKKRRDKSLLDSTSATIILQEYLQHTI